MTTAALAGVCDINPKPSRLPAKNDLVSFLPMAEVNEDGSTTAGTLRPFSEVRSGYTLFERGDVLVAKITPCFENGKIAQASPETDVAAGSTEFHVVRPRPNAADPRYVLHMLRHPHVRLAGERRMTGSGGQRRVPASFLAEMTIPLPPLEEQQRIAAILDKADDLLAKRRAAIAHLDSLTQAIFTDMFGDPALNSLAWPMVPLQSVAASRLGKMLDKKQTTGRDLRPYLRNVNVRWFHLDLEDLAEMDFDERDRAEYELVPGDLLVCEGGEPGRAAMWHGELSNCFFQKALHRVRPDRNHLLPEYLMHLLKHLAERGLLTGHISTATIAHLTGEKLKALPIMLPPVDLQARFAGHIRGLHRLRGGHDSGHSDLEELKAALQARAFRGEL